VINKQRYRSNYSGEFVVTKVTYTNGKKIIDKEYIKNPITNQHISGRAAVIANGSSLQQNVLVPIGRHGGGLLGRKKLQTYGCESIWTKMRLDFCVEYDIKQLEQILASNYQQNTVVYTLTSNLLKMPGEFYLIPYCLHLAAPAAAAYLAAFDGHQEVFLLGVDGTTSEYNIDNKHVIDIKQVLVAYPSTQFRFITDHANPYDDWLQCANAEVWSYHKFVLYCDV